MPVEYIQNENIHLVSRNICVLYSATSAYIRCARPAMSSQCSRYALALDNTRRVLACATQLDARATRSLESLRVD